MSKYNVTGQNFSEKRTDSGSTLIELVMVLSLMTLLGITIFMLIYSGANTQKRVLSEKNSQIEARIALSYINIKLRQNDVSGSVEVGEIKLTGKNALKIKQRGTSMDYDTWIFCLDGKLMECLVNPGEEPTEMLSFLIANTEELVTEIDPDNGTVTNTVYYYYGDSLSKISSTIYPRSF